MRKQMLLKAYGGIGSRKLGIKAASEDMVFDSSMKRKRLSDLRTLITHFRCTA